MKDITADLKSFRAPRTGPKIGVWRLIKGLRHGFLCALVLIALAGQRVQAQVSREFQIKAVFLYNFAQFAEWPSSAFPDEKSPIVIGIVGPDPFGTALEETVHGETIQGHPLTIEHYARAAEIKTCHILFITQPEIRHADEICKNIEGKPVLTVADTDGPSSSAAIIRFVVENNKLHFRINTEAARAENISLSSKLLRVAEVPPSGGKAP